MAKSTYKIVTNNKKTSLLDGDRVAVSCVKKDHLGIVLAWADEHSIRISNDKRPVKYRGTYALRDGVVVCQMVD